VDVAPVNDTPLANDDNHSMQPNTTLTVPAPGVLSNDTDVDVGDTLTAALVSGPGSAQSFSLSPDGSFTYTPTSGFSGTVSFTYVANDGTVDSNVATVTIQVGGSETHSSTDTGDIRDAHPKNGRARTTTFTLDISSTLITSIGTLDLNISIDDGSTNIADLSAVLSNQHGHSHTIATLISGTYPMSEFSGDPLAGMWTLEITDSVKKSSHVLTSWSLTATQASSPAAPAPESASAADMALLSWTDVDSSEDDETNPLATQAADELALMLVE
jgi:hypothetical protein